jgi:pimeloyl-ACP methyl ester carboxylesterase
MASASFLTSERRGTFERTLTIVETDFSKDPVANLFVDVLFGGEEDDVMRAVFSEFVQRSGNGPQVAKFMRAQLEIDVRSEARQIRVPTLVFHARDDQTVLLEAGRELAALIPGARFEIVDGTHLVGTGNQPETRRRILEFLAEGGD